MNDKDREILLKILKHVRHAINHCSKYTEQEQFEADDMCVEATVFNLNCLLTKRQFIVEQINSTWIIILSTIFSLQFHKPIDLV